MTTAEAINEINIRIELANRWFAGPMQQSTEALELAMEALRKQEPMKPIRTEKSLYCPNCVHWLSGDDIIPNEWDNYCRICGQKINLEDEA